MSKHILRDYELKKENGRRNIIRRSYALVISKYAVLTGTIAT